MDDFKTLLSVKKIMKTKIVVQDINAVVSETAALMLKEDTDAIMVSDGEDLVGIVTESDIVRKIVAKRIAPETVTIGKLMCATVIHIQSDESIFEAKKIMEAKAIRHLIVKDGDKVSGIVSARDLVKN